MSGLKIEKVLAGSVAEEMEIEAGDILLSINGNEIRDIIDYNFYSGDDELVLEIAKPEGEIWEVDIEKSEDETLGLIFSAPKPFRCGNRCVFCFVDQLPRGMRQPLYVKDEDYRLSFLYGNYVTLANIGPLELERIKEQRLSPLYISVHATEPRLRERMLGKEGILPVLDVMRELAAAGIVMHTQVVLCPGINDGKALDDTVAEMTALHPMVASLAIVPVGLTRHRGGLAELKPVTAEYARNILTVWHPRSKKIAEEIGAPFLFLADEFFLKAGIPFPPLDEYGELPQLENGVGMIPLFREEAREVLAVAEPLSLAATAVTGVSPLPVLQEFLADLSKKTGAHLDCVAVKNVLFGESVSVTGLVPGGDIIAALKDIETAGIIIIPDVMLKEGEGIFLDDVTVNDLEQELGKVVLVAESTPWGIYQVLLEYEQIGRISR